jgi:cobalt-zinc-cadmium efflux system protein
MTMAESEAVLARLNHELCDHYGIAHTTIQLEVTGCETTHGCAMPPTPDVIDGHSHHHHGPGGHTHGHAHAH